MDPENEKTSAFSRVGSFYYRGLEDTAKKEAIRMAHLTFQTRAFRQLDNVMNAVTSGGYFPGNFRVVRFTDKQVAWYGVKRALQQRITASYEVDSSLPPEDVVRTWDARQAVNKNNNGRYSGFRFTMRACIDTGVIVSDTPFDDFPDTFVLKGCDIQRDDASGMSTQAFYILDSNNLVVGVAEQASTAGPNGYYEQTFVGVDGAPVRLNTDDTYTMFIIGNPDEVTVGTVLPSPVTTFYTRRIGVASLVQGGSTDALNLMSGASVHTAHKNFTPCVIFHIEGVVQVPVKETKEAANRPGHLTIPDHFNPITERNDGLSVRYKPLLMPDSNYGDTVLPPEAELVYGLLVDPELMITSISLDDGTVLLANQDFSTEFGILHFFENPIKLFPKMKFMARSYIERKRNLYCYPLRLANVYGPVDKVIDYYRKTQSPRALYYAAAQAIGMPVVIEDDVILSVSPLLDGAAYYTEKGHRYDAAFPHTHYIPGTSIKQNDVIAGAELFRLYSVGDTLPENLPGVQLRHSAAVNGLYVPNKDGRIFQGEYFRPEYEELVPGALQRYYDYVEVQEGDMFRQYKPTVEFLFQDGQFAQGTNGATLDMLGSPTAGEGPGGMSAITGNFAWQGIQDGGASKPGNGKWSVSFWYKYRVAPGSTGSYNLVGYYPTGDFWLVSIGAGILMFNWFDSSAGGINLEFQVAAANVNTVDTWHHVVVTIDRETGTFAFYFDGSIAGTDVQDRYKGVTMDPTSPFRTSAEATMEAGGVSIADMAFYKGYVLFPEDVEELYDNGTNGITAAGTLLPAVPQEGNLLDNLLDQALAGRWILVMVNENMMPRSMQLRLDEFLRREAPIGSALLYSPLEGILAETEIADV